MLELDVTSYALKYQAESFYIDEPVLFFTLLNNLHSCFKSPVALVSPALPLNRIDLLLTFKIDYLDFQ
jgi:hypothetical protein